MENRESPAKYLDFILQKSIEDLRRDGKYRLDYDAVNMYFNYVRKAKDTLKAVYTLMHIAKMKDTGVYLTFVLKKIKEGAVNFDTLDENAREDCEYIKNEVIKNFSLSGEPGEEPELKIPEISGSGLSEMIKENKFKVKSDEDASIAEEFSEKEFYSSVQDTDEDSETTGIDSNEVSAKEENEENIKMSFGDEEFELISNSEEGEEGFEILQEKQDKEILETGQIEEPETITESAQIENEETEESKEISEYPGEIEGEGFVIKKKLKIEESAEEDNLETLNVDEEDGKGDEVKSEEQSEEMSEEDVVEESVVKDELIGDNTDDEKNESEDFDDAYDDGYIESEVISEEIEEAELVEESSEEFTGEPEPEVSEQYKDYEKTLFEVNELLKDYFLDIESVPEGAASPDGEPVIFGKISELCNIMRNRSDKMSFSIISNVYKNTGAIFKEYLKTNSRPNADELEKFKNGISLVEGLIRGDDLPEADDIIASLETLRNSFKDDELVDKTDSMKEVEEDKASEKSSSGQSGIDINPADKQDYKESSKPLVSLKEKYSNVELRESFKQLKLQIQDLENIFRSLDEIEGDYQNYEGLRTLSATFLNLKEIIRRAKILELRNVAKLSEASYVFIKFIQNYRMNPFDEDIREIFKYIIYNFKAAALDKPNEDLERFISYLNDPVKIFTQKNKK